MSEVRVWSVPMRTRFRGIDVRDGVLVRGPAGWGEFSPFWDYDVAESRRWWAAAHEAATGGWPAPVRDRVPVNVTVPAVDAERAHAIVTASGCRTAKVKVADPGQTEADDLARGEAGRDALGAAGAIRVDANAAWDVDTAVTRIKALDAAVGLEYVEQPCAGLEELVALRRRIDGRVGADGGVRRWGRGRGRAPVGRSAPGGPAGGLRRRRPQGAAAGRGARGPAGGRGARAAVRGVVGAGVVGGDRRRSRAGPRAPRAAFRLRAGHGRPVHRRRHQQPAPAGRRRAAGGPAGARQAGRAGRRSGDRCAVAGAAGPGERRVNPSTALARVLVDELVRGGVTDAVLAPGSRSAPVALALAAAERAGRLRLHVRIDERTAAFLALGLAKASGRPVPVLTTSGTAAAHLHAAVLEADASGVPLLALTADRPPELRATGANQTIDQTGLYGGAARWTADVGVPEEGREEAQNRYWRSLVAKALLMTSGALSGDPGPVHLNLALRDPLLPDDEPAEPAGPWAGRPGGLPWTTAGARAAPPPEAPPPAR